MVQQLLLKSLDFSIGCKEKVDSNSGTNFEVLQPCGGKASRIAVRKGTPASPMKVMEVVVTGEMLVEVLGMMVLFFTNCSHLHLHHGYAHIITLLAQYLRTANMQGIEILNLVDCTSVHSN